jgi:HTH-type transcriptional regulator / antitoxin HigA
MSNRNRTTRIAVPDEYLALVKRFPIREIRNATEHRAALSMVRELTLRGDDDLRPGEIEYLRALSRFVTDYEHGRFSVRQLGPRDLLKHLMMLHGMSGGDLGRILGSSSAASMILRGQRQLSKSHIKALAEHFAVSPALFL